MSRVALAWLVAGSMLLPPRQIVVRTPAKSVTVEVTTLTDGPAVRADRLAEALGTTLRPLDAAFEMRLEGKRLRFTGDVPYLWIDSTCVPLSTPPHLVDAHLYVPLQVVSDVLPRLVDHLAYDAKQRELRLVSSVAKTEPPTVSAENTATAPPAADGRRARAPTNADHRPLVVVDAGHGGPDRGMSGPIGGATKIYEKDITLAVAKKLAASLRDRGFRVLMTRTTDTLIALADRGRIANEAKADLFVSIHVNAANLGWTRPEEARGFETYFLSEAKTEDARRVEQMENEVVKYEHDSNLGKRDALSFILKDMSQNESLRESCELARIVEDGLREMHPGPDRGVKQANFAVLRTSFMPAVLIEIGFGTNRAEAAFISGEAHQQALATAITNSLARYLDRRDQRLSGGR